MCKQRIRFLRYILSKNVDCRVFDTWKKKSVLSLIMSLIYIVRTKRSEPIILSISTRGAYYIAKILNLTHLNGEFSIGLQEEIWQ